MNWKFQKCLLIIALSYPIASFNISLIQKSKYWRREGFSTYHSQQPTSLCANLMNALTKNELDTITDPIL